MRSAAVALAVLALPGCKTSDGCDSATEVCAEAQEQNPYGGKSEISDVRWSCCDPATDASCDAASFWYEVVTQGRPRSVVMRILEGDASTGWLERHPLTSSDQDPEGYWEDFQVTLLVSDTTDCATLTDCADLWSPGISTLFPCAESWTATQMTWGIWVTDTEGDACATWGADPSQFEDCTVWPIY